MKNAILIVCAIVVFLPFIAAVITGLTNWNCSDNGDGLTAYDVIAELAKHGVVISKFTGFDEDARVSQAAVDHMLSQIDSVDYSVKKAICAAFLRQYFHL